MSTDTTTAPDHPTLQHFTLDDLAMYTAEQAFGPTASPDFRVFYVGRDDVHGVLMHLYSRVSLSVKMNMFGYDDDELNKVLMGLVQNPSVMVQVTLDKSQSGGVHEKAILASDMAQDAEGCANDFANRSSGSCLDELFYIDRYAPRRPQHSREFGSVASWSQRFVWLDCCRSG